MIVKCQRCEALLAQIEMLEARLDKCRENTQLSENTASGGAKHIHTWRGRPVRTEEEMRTMECPWPPEVDFADKDQIKAWMDKMVRRVGELEAQRGELLEACRSAKGVLDDAIFTAFTERSKDTLHEIARILQAAIERVEKEGTND